MVIVQVIKDNIVPVHLKSYVDSAKDFAEKNKYEYIVHSDFDSEKYPVRVVKSTHDFSDQYLHTRTLSEIIRLKYLSTIKNVLYVDFDVYLYDNFIIPPVESICRNDIDCMIYNGDNTDRYKKILDGVMKKEWKTGDMLLSQAFVNEPDFKTINKFDKNSYIHITNCNLCFKQGK